MDANRDVEVVEELRGRLKQIHASNRKEPGGIQPVKFSGYTWTELAETLD